VTPAEQPQARPPKVARSALSWSRWEKGVLIAFLLVAAYATYVLITTPVPPILPDHGGM